MAEEKPLVIINAISVYICVFCCLIFSLWLVGLKYGVEVGKSVDDPNPVYYCSICDDYFNSGVKLRHFTGTLHRKTVVVRILAALQSIPYQSIC